MLRILFLCTGNGGRSQMAASFAEKLAFSKVEIVCAGDARRALHPMALKVMHEIGQNIATSVVLTLEDVKLQPFDLVVTLCENAKKICPTFPGCPARIHWPMTDPAKHHLEAEYRVRAEFVYVRNEISRRIEGLFLHGFLDAMQQLRQTFGSLLDNLTDGALGVDDKRKIFFFNRAAQEITGLDSSEVVGQDCREVFTNHFYGCNFAFGEGEQNPAQSKLPYLHTIVNRNGEPRDLEMSVVATNTSLKEPTGPLIIFHDVTEVVRLRKRLEQSRGFCGIVGRHASMQKVFDTIRELADVDAPILIQGERGTGKEMVATALHQLSKRSAGPFVTVNCGALPDSTLESELFGNVRRTLTGTTHDRKGNFALAEGGTIFLDTIGKISAAMQAKLVRVIQEKSFMPVGGEKSRKSDVRIICATSRDLKLLTQQGLFREDLYYLLASARIQLPPLHERWSDIPILVEHFLDKFSNNTGKNVKEISPRALELLMRYHWPGNVWELGNVIQYGIAKCGGGVLDLQHLPREIRELREPAEGSKPGRPPKLNQETVLDALHRSGGNRAKAARLLGVSRTTLYRFIDSKKVSYVTHM